MESKLNQLLKAQDYAIDLDNTFGVSPEDPPSTPAKIISKKKVLKIKKDQVNLAVQTTNQVMTSNP